MNVEKYEIYETLKQLEIPPFHDGFKYLIELIDHMIAFPCSFTEGYNYIALKFDKTPTQVERCMRSVVHDIDTNLEYCQIVFGPAIKNIDHFKISYVVNGIINYLQYTLKR